MTVAQQHTLQRVAFQTSRAYDFCNRKGLVTETGHEVESWPLVIIKELMDNALDACEEAGTAPEITVTVDPESGVISVADNGPGIPPEIVVGIVDFNRRVSQREAYVAPDRGAQGNALKTLVAMPYVLDSERGLVVIRARGVEHRITMRADQVRQEPVVDHEQRETNGMTGTTIAVHLPPDSASLQETQKRRFLQLAESYTWLNPHLTLSIRYGGDPPLTFEATDTGWSKWRPSDPTCPHWYRPDHLARLVAAHIAHGADTASEKTVREFIAEFRGLSGSAKQKRVLEATGLARAQLSELARNGQLDMERIENLLEAMKEHTRPVKPKQLGLIGKEHLQARFESAGCELKTFKYAKEFGESAGVPYVLEFAFGYCPDLDSGTPTTNRRFHNNEMRRLITGVNWSPGIVNPFRHLGTIGKSCDAILAEQRIDPNDPVILVLHCACPRVEFADRGKSTLYLGGKNHGR